MIQRAILYGLETVPQTKKTTRRLEVADMKMTRIGRVRNEDRWKRMRVTNIGVRCRRARLRWFGYVKRRERNHVGRRMLSMVPPGMRRRERQRQRWMDTINPDMRSGGAREEDTQEREIWKAFISAAVTS